MAAWSESDKQRLRELYEEGVSVDSLAEMFGRTHESVKNTATRLRLRRPTNTKTFSVVQPPSAGRTITRLLADLSDAYKRKEAHSQAKKDGVDIHLDDPKPYGILLFGDPHLGDPGCDLETLTRHMALVRETPGLYGINLGDLSNNWIGGLQRLYGHQETTADDERALVDWCVGGVDWLAVILGNHDKWSSHAEHACKNAGVAYVSHGAKFNIHAGGTVFRLDARHKRRGFSMYNASHAQLKALFRGNPCHVVTAAHIHQSAETVINNPQTGHTGIALQVGAYKKHDEYADANDMDGSQIGPAVLVTVDTRKDGEDTIGFIKTWWDIDSGIEYLGWLRKNT